MTRSKIGALLLASSVCGAFNAPVAARPYPSQPVKVISDSSAGSAPDVILRVVGEGLTQHWGQQVLVINQPGASGSRAARAAAAATPDGYSLFMAVSSAFVTLKGTAPGIPIELPGDLAPISLIAENPMFMVASPQIGVKSLSALIELAAKKPGEISYAVSPAACRSRDAKSTSSRCDSRSCSRASTAHRISTSPSCRPARTS